MNLKAYIVALLAAPCLIGTANAVTITNRDTESYKVTVSEGDNSNEVNISPSQKLDGICLNGCTLRLNDKSDEYVLEGDEVVSIEGSELYMDEPAAQGSGPDPDNTRSKEGTTSQ